MYYAFLSGNGGCDYTMGCNCKLVKMKATTIHEAHKEAEQLVDDYSDYVSELKIIGVAEEHEYNVVRAKSLLASRLLEEAQKESTEKQRKQYEELKKKFDPAGQ